MGCACRAEINEGGSRRWWQSKTHRSALGLYRPCMTIRSNAIRESRMASRQHAALMPSPVAANELALLAGRGGSEVEGLSSTDRCSHVAVRRLPGNARLLQRLTLASTPGARDVLKLARVPLSLVATLATLPSISEIPFLDCFVCQYIAKNGLL